MSASTQIRPTQKYAFMKLYVPPRKIIWEYLRLDSGEYVAGCIAALYNILPFGRYTLNIGSGPTLNPVAPHDALLQFVTFQNIDVSEIEHYPISSPEFGWWIQARDHAGYDLYKFKTIDFTEGFINTCKQFDIDFRTYIHAPPFQDGVYYDISGYDISIPSDHAIADAVGIPAYTGSYENANRDKN